MAASKEVATIGSSWSPDFIRDLLPSAERTALLYHLSYLCLGNFPKLERLLREQAVETQMLFGSSEAVLLKCVGTSDNLVKYLLPSLKVAAEKNKPELAQKFLEKAKVWITDIIRDVEKIKKRYEEHNRDVAKSTSDINIEKDETEKKQQKNTSEMEALQKAVNSLEGNLNKIIKEIEEYEKKIEKKNAEIQSFISSISNTKEQQKMQMPGVNPAMGPAVAIISMIVPFVESIVSHICKAVAGTAHEATIRTLQGGLSDLSKEQQRLREKEWEIQNQLMDKQLQLAKLNIEKGQIPSVTHLDEVQKCLSRIQQILIQLQKFWEKVGSLLDTLKDRTFAGDIWLEDLADMKEEFLKSIETAKEGWKQFGSSCMKAEAIFSIQANEAYRFLEINPSSLSKEEWQKEYDSVNQKLKMIKPNTPSNATITELKNE